MALQVGNMLVRCAGQNHLRCFTSIANKLLQPNINHASRDYSKKSDSLTPTTEETAKPKTALEKAKDVASKIKEAKRKFDLYDPLNQTAQPTLFEAQLPPRAVDIVIVGGGIMGCSIAYHLCREENLIGAKVLVIERDPCYTRASTVLSVGGIRQQFSIPENVKMSMYSSQFLRESKYLLTVDGKDLTDVQFNHQGYLFLATEAGVETMEKNHKVQKDCGASVELLTPRQIKAKFPWINTDGVALGSYGLENEGWFDPWSLLKGLRQKAVAHGCRFINGEVLDFNVLQPGKKDVPLEQHFAGDGRRVRGVKVKAEGYDDVMDVNCAILVLASGWESGRMGRLMGIGEGSASEWMDVPIPVEPRKRYVYVVHAPDGPSIDCPFIVDPSGAYIRREGFGGNYVCGISPEVDSEEPPVDVTSMDDLAVDYDWFDEKLWPKLAHRVPAFNNLKVKSAWAGYYDYNTVDQNAIIGMHPGFPNVYVATGFTGHGIQQAPAVGRYIRDLIFDGEPQDLDLSRFGFERFIYKTPLKEANVV
ncbi:FAD-dependent oxidoreductase domain-containing protein 1-like [Amphiura filiformis]|uniref:FAD-dependent oxidoreductase domain-containing protein 1-like n=1 Tax=Amphiura filiformis TaxID=82378 RepID=UPI003B21ADA1